MFTCVANAYIHTYMHTYIHTYMHTYMCVCVSDHGRLHALDIIVCTVCMYAHTCIYNYNLCSYYITVLKFKHNVAPIRLHVVVQTQDCTVHHMPCDITILLHYVWAWSCNIMRFITRCMGVVSLHCITCNLGS